MLEVPPVPHRPLARRWLAATVAVIVVLAGLMAVSPAQRADAAAPGPKDAIAVLFSYTWNRIAQECETTLGPAGYGYVQTSPPQEHAMVANEGNPWWIYYQPVSYRLESRMGSEAEFRSMVQRCNAAGVGVIVDAVINHMSGQSNGGTGWAGTQFQHYSYPGLYESSDFHSCRRDIDTYAVRETVQNCNLVNLSDLDTGKASVQQKIADYLNRLADMGVKGFRFDAVKHISKDDMWGIWNRVTKKDQLYVVQEVIRAAGEPIQPEEYIGIGDIHEFAYARKMKEAFGGSRIDWLISGAGIGGTWGGFLQQKDAATFVDNHDTERNGETLSYKNGKTYDLAQTFTLAWPYGSPSIHSGYQFTDVKRAPAVDAQGRVVDPAPGQNGWTFKHAQNDIKNMVGFRVATYGTDVVDKWSSSDGSAIAFGRGSKGFVAINNGSGQVQRQFTTSLPDGTDYNVITAQKSGSTWSGETVTVRGGTFTATVAGTSALALHVDARVAACTDTAAPSTPANVKAVASGTEITVAWDASTDDCGVSGYEVVRTGGAGGAVTKQVASGTRLVDSGLAASTSYSYTVKAKDAAGKTSVASTAAAAQTGDVPAPVVTTVYYKAPSSWSAANIHYQLGTGAWTTVPGKPMAVVPSCAAGAGWYRAEIETGAATSVTAAFNNNAGVWDNNGGKNYTFVPKTAAISAGAVSTADPCRTTPEEPVTATTVYYQAPSGWSAANIHFKVGSGAWTTAPGRSMTAVAGLTGWFQAAVEAPAGQSITAAFNNGVGSWDSNGGANYTIPSGGERSVSGGAVTAGKPVAAEPLAGELTLYYKPSAAWTTVNAHYQLGAGSWTAVPGKPMAAVASCDAGAGWYRLAIATGSAASVTAAFNNGSGTWDNNGGKNYTFTSKTAAVSSGAVSTADPCGAAPEEPEEPEEPEQPVVPGVPASVTAVASGTSVTVSWTAVSGAEAYTIEYAPTTGGAAVAVKVTGAASRTITGLAAETAYSFAVRAENAAGASAYSARVPATTGSATIAQPGGSVAGATTGSPLGGDPREDSIYFMMTARWSDGDESNNMGGSQHVKSGNAANDDPMFRGDFRGVIDKLDYIKGLGFSAIWITPVVTNRSDYDFHGYHGWDFQRIDPRLESDGATYQELIDAAHAKGIKIYQDVVYNHTSRWGEKNLFVPTVYGTRDTQWSWYYDEKVPGKAYNPAEPDADGSTYNGDLWSQTQPAGQNCKNWGVQSGFSAEGYKVYQCQWPNATSGMFPSDVYHQ